MRDEADRLRFRGGSGLFWFYLVLAAVMVAVSLSLVVGGVLEKNGTAPLVTGIVTGFGTVPVLVMASAVLRPVVLTDQALLVPKAVGRRLIPVSDIAGVGLLYRRSPGTRRPEGWFLEIWDTAGRRMQVDRFVVTTLLERRPPPALGEKPPKIAFGRDPSLSLPHENPDDLAATRAGRVAKDIYAWVLARQGPNGPLATMALQKSSSYDPAARTETWAWWSPEGTMARLRH